MINKLQRLISASYQLYKFKQQYEDLLYLYPGIEIAIGGIENIINNFIQEETKLTNETEKVD